jgi:hypothetical protein
MAIYPFPFVVTDGNPAAPSICRADGLALQSPCAKRPRQTRLYAPGPVVLAVAVTAWSFTLALATTGFS